MLEIGDRRRAQEARTHHADADDLALLRARGERGGERRAAEHRDEFAAFHSITLSAAASNVVGMSMPRTLAVCMLMTKSNLVARNTGMSAGFSPLRTRPV